MQLDTLTIVFMTAAICALISALLFVSWRHNRAETTLGWWSACYLSCSLGCALLLPRGIISDLLSIDLANALILWGVALGWAGSRAFDGRRTPIGATLAGAAIWLVACRVPEFYQSPAYRTAGVSAIYACYCVAIALQYWRGRADRLTARYMLVVAHGALALMYGVRTPMAFFAPPPSHIMAPDLWFAVSVLVPILIGIASAVLVVAVTKERAEADLRVAAAHDTLTGTLNRGALIDRAGRLLDGPGVVRKAAMLVFDLDRFKQINDRFGHAAGDRALVVFVDIARSQLRSGDLLGRIGGEEFAAILPGAGEADALTVAERIRAAFALCRIEHAGIAIPSTVSIGVSVADGGEKDLDQLMAEADRALYLAKNAGRDRVFGPLALAS